MNIQELFEDMEQRAEEGESHVGYFPEMRYMPVVLPKIAWWYLEYIVANCRDGGEGDVSELVSRCSLRDIMETHLPGQTKIWNEQLGEQWSMDKWLSVVEDVIAGENRDNP